MPVVEATVDIVVVLAVLFVRRAMSKAARPASNKMATRIDPTQQHVEHFKHPFRRRHPMALPVSFLSFSVRSVVLTFSADGSW